MPQFEIESKSKTPGREQIAAAIEHYLGGVTVSDFVTPPSVRFARGTGSITFSEVVDWSAKEDHTIGIFTEATSSTGIRVAMCMFGSRDNLADMLPTTSEREGWSSSAAPSIVNFIRSRCTAPDRHWDEVELAEEAVNMLLHQGEPGPSDQPQMRGFTLGHISDFGEWMMEVYFDVDFTGELLDYVAGGYDRVLLGAPLWIRTPTPEALVIYNGTTRTHARARAIR
ncbi:hypothetical protein BJY16_003216 [Actinoplanes octamycinicus]|uniref:Uncharacterized protein n=1 Tax=Actinoplanes octamycinicus TaxID=135948 RepID=A0A7W7M7C7_9ACTN|nr:hypothetical protein [Actinoplanes octamycinicus]MBB4739757.1 hypothetical protein [Actinoplanes octamycinicus]GIE54942.1 hypothetical protein Aoc01nite_03440 [Actinoplanes octamycinicus]